MKEQENQARLEPNFAHPFQALAKELSQKLEVNGHQVVWASRQTLKKGEDITGLMRNLRGKSEILPIAYLAYLIAIDDEIIKNCPDPEVDLRILAWGEAGIRLVYLGKLELLARYPNPFSSKDIADWKRQAEALKEFQGKLFQEKVAPAATEAVEDPKHPFAQEAI